MIERTFASEAQDSTAFYSPCLQYRYGLRRTWDSGGGEILFVMLNPSTATEERNDPTIERCQRRAARLGFGGMRIANLFAWRATRPADLRGADDPVGLENDALLLAWTSDVALTIAAWGVHGAFRDRAAQVAPLLRGEVRHLGLTRDGHPRHPLYVRNDAPLLPFAVPEPADA